MDTGDVLFLQIFKFNSNENVNSNVNCFLPDVEDVDCIMSKFLIKGSIGILGIIYIGSMMLRGLKFVR